MILYLVDLVRLAFYNARTDESSEPEEGEEGESEPVFLWWWGRTADDKCERPGDYWLLNLLLSDESGLGDLR